MAPKTLTKKKTKSQIEADFPIIKPEDCPRELMKWIVDRDEKMLNKIEELIDKMFEKYFKKYISMIYGNRIWLVVLSAVTVVIVIVLWLHIIHVR